MYNIICIVIGQRFGTKTHFTWVGQHSGVEREAKYMCFMYKYIHTHTHIYIYIEYSMGIGYRKSNNLLCGMYII